MSTRRAHPDESRAVADVWLRSRAAAFPAIPAPAHTKEEVHAYFETEILATRDVWVSEHNAVVVALLVLDEDWIDQLYVDPAHVGSGFGSTLIAVAKRERPRGLKLWTFEANTRARLFYEHHGFVETGATDGDNEEGAPDVRYEWRPELLAP